MYKIKLTHILLDSKIHIIAVSTLLNVYIAVRLLSNNTAIWHLALLYSLIAMWMVVDYKVSLIIQSSKNLLWGYLIPIFVVCFWRFIIVGETLFISTVRLFVVAVLVVLIHNILNLQSSQNLGLLMAVIIELIVPLKEQPATFVLMTESCVAGALLTLLVAFVYYDLVDYSAYLKYKKKEHNEELICKMIAMQLRNFLNRNKVDWELLRTEIKEFKENRFFYNKIKHEEDKSELFYNLVIELYCILTMLKGFSSFDKYTIEEAKKVFGDKINMQPVADAALFHCENVSVRALLFNFNILQDIIMQRVNSYTFKK